MSTPNRNIAVVDAGLKALAVDSGMPTIWQRPDIRYLSASDEHGKLDVASETTPPKLGEKLRLVPGHCDPTVDRYDWYVGVRARTRGVSVADSSARRHALRLPDRSKRSKYRRC